MSGSDARFLRRVLNLFYGVPEKSVKLVRLGEGNDSATTVMWREVGEDGKAVTKSFTELSEAVAYLTAE